MVCAFQILEHIPFEEFEPAVAKLAGIARRHVVISLPQWGRPLELRLRLLKNRFTLHWARRLYHGKDWKFDGQHYWELGARGYPPERIHQALSRQLRVVRSYVCPDNSYHYFFECEVKDPTP